MKKLIFILLFLIPKLCFATDPGTVLIIDTLEQKNAGTFPVVNATDAGIADAGDYYTSTNVEDALQEIASGPIVTPYWAKTIDQTLLTGDKSGSFDLTTTGTLGAGATTVTNLTDSGLTSGRIPYASTGGLFVDNSALTFTLTEGLYAGRNIGIGASPYTYGATGEEYVLNLARTFTDNTALAGRKSVNAAVIWNPTGTGTITQYIIGGDFSVDSSAGNVVNNSGYLNGLRAFVQHRANTTINQAIGFIIYAGTYNSGSDTTGTITYNYGGILEGLKTASSTITNNTGLMIENFSGASTIGLLIQNNTGSSSLYDIYASDTGALNYFAGKTGIGIASPTAVLHLKAGTATANTAPLKLNTGTALTTPEDGAVEYHTSHLYFTIGSTRYQLDQQSSTITGTDTHVMFFDGANTPAGDAGFTYNKTTNTATIDSIVLNGITSDPASLTDGQVWYRSDTKQIRCRIDATTYQLVVNPI